MSVELLAPAKDKYCAKVAVDFGTDALYMGAYSFGARKNAGNSIDDIKEVVDYAHKFGVKVYVTVNTLIEDEELPKVQQLIYELDKINVDGLIIQDMKILSLDLPEELSIHASTQCDNRTLDKVKKLEECGFSRVVLARELSLDEIKNIKENSDIELETFIHGALCVSYSGRCYLSETIGSRSANKGDCAQPCRKKYSLIDDEGKIYAKDKYLLSLKDFNASRYIKNLVDIGVKSLKIEGRLKDENYVKNIVAYYRKLLDKFTQKSSCGEVFYDFEPDIEKSFNRGFCEYFLNGRNKDIYNFNSQKSLGEKVGKISKVGKDFFELEYVKNKNIIFSPNDGICFYINNELTGCLINKTIKNRIFPNKMSNFKVGMEIYRNSDVAFEKILKNSKTNRKIMAKFIIEKNKISVIDCENNMVETSFNFEEYAQNQDKMSENFVKQFKKSGESIFLITDVEIKLQKLPYLAISQLNEIRRNLLEKLEEKRLTVYKRNKNKALKPFVEENKNYPVMTTKHCLKYAFDMCGKDKKLFLIDEKGKKWRLNFNCKKCEMEIYNEL